MCGQFGIITTKKRINNATEFMRDGFVASSLRGMDSSGIASIKIAAKQPVYQKLPVCGSMFIQDNYARYLMGEAAISGRISIGHTRAGTMGGISLNNAHPFLVEAVDDSRSLVGTHNGTLTGWQSKPGAKSFDVDSEWALNHIYDKGLDAFQDFTGAYCFVWWDSEDANQLKIALNDERPMWITMLKEDGMAYASEAGMLYWLLERNNIAMEGSLLKLVPKHLYTFDVASLKDYKRVSLPQPKVVYSQSSHGYYHGGNRAYKTTVEQVTEMLTRVKGTNESKPAQLLLPATKHVGAHTVTKEEEEIAKEYLMHNDVGWFTPIILDTETGELMGSYKHKHMKDMDAIIRNGTELWNSRPKGFNSICIGIQDAGDNKPIVAVCKPVLEIVQKAESVH